MGKPHVVIITYPAQGQINPMMQLAKFLHFKGFFITFISTESVLRSRGPDALKGIEDFQFEIIPDGLLLSDCRSQQQVVKQIIKTHDNCAAPLRELLVKLNHSSSIPPINCIILNFLMRFALDVAEKLSIPVLLFNTMSACGIMGYLSVNELIQKGYTPIKDESCLTNEYLDTPIDWIPGMKDVRLRDLPSVIRTTDHDDYFLNSRKRDMEDSLKAWGLIINTFDDMESEVLDALKCMFPRVYTVGPLTTLLNQIADNQLKSMHLTLWPEDSSCKEWLNAQRANSVVYVNFGSISVATADQLTEFAWGLLGSNHPFLWVIRPDQVVSEQAALSQDFITEAKGKGLLISWCLQEEVLCHSSIGCFLTHGGWNSMLESISAGVPMICWPGFAEQYTNCRYVCKACGIGMEIDKQVKREQVTELVRELMGARGDEMRKNVMKLKEMAGQATRQGGTSYASLERLTKDLSSGIMGP